MPRRLCARAIGAEPRDAVLYRFSRRTTSESLRRGPAAATPYGQPVGATQQQHDRHRLSDATALASGSQWTGSDAAGKTVITYSFSNAASAFDGDSAQFSASLQEFTAADKATTRTLLSTISAVCNVTFVEVADSAGQCGQVRYAYSQAPNAMGYVGLRLLPVGVGDRPVTCGSAPRRPRPSGTSTAPT